jgi:hypothetical protein
MKPEIKKALDNLAVIIDKRARYETGEEYVQIANDFRLIKAELESNEVITSKDNGTPS